MVYAAYILTAVAAILHGLFLVLEMFFWDGPSGGSKILGMTPDQVKASAPLARNQGLYNGFLAAGMAYTLTGGPGSYAIGIFSLACGVVAGMYGAATIKPSFAFIQALPSGAALLCFALLQR